VGILLRRLYRLPCSPPLKSLYACILLRDMVFEGAIFASVTNHKAAFAWITHAWLLFIGAGL
jgi:hypothetical protein